MQIAIETLSWSSLPSNLDEAAKDYCNSQPGWENKMDWAEEKDKEECRRDFRAGAEWMTEQGLVSEGIIINQMPGEDTMIELNEYIDNLEDCEEVIVNIRKKQ